MKTLSLLLLFLCGCSGSKESPFTYNTLIINRTKHDLNWVEVKYPSNWSASAGVLSVDSFSVSVNRHEALPEKVEFVFWLDSDTDRIVDLRPSREADAFMKERRHSVFVDIPAEVREPGAVNGRCVVYEISSLSKAQVYLVNDCSEAWEKN